MHILFTRGKTFYSKIICDVLQEPISHVSVLDGDIVYHSDLLGVRKEPYESFASRQDVIIKVPVDKIDNIEERFRKYDKSLYDIGATLYIGVYFLLRRYTGLKLKKANLWQSSGMYICTEWVTKLLGEVDSMITPYQLYRKLTEAKHGKSS